MFLLARHESQELDKKEGDNSEDKPQLKRGRVWGQGRGQGGGQDRDQGDQGQGWNGGQDRRGGRGDCAAC